MQTKRVRNALLSYGEDIPLMILDRGKERVRKIKAARSRIPLEILISVGATKSYLPLRSLAPFSFTCLPHVVFFLPICFLSLLRFLDIYVSTLSNLLLRYHCSLISYSMYNQSGQPTSLFTGDSKRCYYVQRFNQK